MVQELRKECLKAIIDCDRASVDEMIEAWALKNGYENVVEQILEPVMEELGEMWNVQRDVTFAQAYVSATIAEDILLKVLKHKGAVNTKKSKGTIILGNIEDDFHSIGRRLVGIFLMTAGWRIVDLGNDVTPVEFVNRAIEEDAKIIAVSAMMYTTAQNIKRLREEIDQRGMKGKIQLAVGGAVFNLRISLCKEVGGDGVSRNAVDVGALMDRLWEQAIKAGESQ